MMDIARKQQLLSVYRDGLLYDTLPFWIPRCVDREHGGFMMALDREGAVIDTDKGVWQQGRFTWLLGELYNNVEQREEWLELAKHGAEFMDAALLSIRAMGECGSMSRVTEDQSANGVMRSAKVLPRSRMENWRRPLADDAYAEKARRTFQRFIDHNLNPQDTPAKFTDTRPTRGIGFPMITIVTAQELRDSIGLGRRERVDRSQHRNDPRFSSQGGHRVRDGNGWDRWPDHQSF